jgi:hypothetical protein
MGMEWKRFSQITEREALLYEAVERLASTALTHQSEIMNGNDGEVAGWGISEGRRAEMLRIARLELANDTQ